MLEEQINQDIKAALLAGDSTTATTLRGVKAVLLNVKVATGKRETGLSDDVVVPLLAKEAKKRQESADLYVQGGNQEKATAELTEKKLIESYLPAAPTEDELSKLIDEVLSQSPNRDPRAMGQMIGQVKAKAGPTADGALIARLVKDKLQ